jgi:hypothetical protein
MGAIKARYVEANVALHTAAGLGRNPFTSAGYLSAGPVWLAPNDGARTAADQDRCCSAMPSGAQERILTRQGTRPSLLVLPLQKLDIDLGAVDADQLASAIGKARRR